MVEDDAHPSLVVPASKTLRHAAEAAEKNKLCGSTQPARTDDQSWGAEEAMSLMAQPHIKNDFKSKTKTAILKNRNLLFVGTPAPPPVQPPTPASHTCTERCRSSLTMTAPSLVTAPHIRSHGVR